MLLGGYSKPENLEHTYAINLNQSQIHITQKKLLLNLIPLCYKFSWNYITGIGLSYMSFEVLPFIRDEQCLLISDHIKLPGIMGFLYL